MHRTLYLDESGDLGFSPDSSQYLVVCFLSTAEPNALKRVVRRAKRRLGIPAYVELKGHRLTWPQRKVVLTAIARLGLSIHTIAVQKANVFHRLRDDQNLIYNYAAHFPFLAHVKTGGFTSVTVVVDQRTKKILSGGMEIDRYLKMKTWAEEGLDVEIQFEHVDSNSSLGVQGVDVVANAIGRKYEKGHCCGYNIVAAKIKYERRLYAGGDEGPQERSDS